MTGRPFRILAVNSNTDDRVTDRVTRAIRDVLPGCQVEGVTAGFGPRGIGGRADLTISAMATLSAAVDHEGDHDAVIVACFSDPGLYALREVLDVPVVGIGEASFLTAAQLGARFCVVTVGPRVVHVIEEAVQATGLASRFAGVEIVDSAASPSNPQASGPWATPMPTAFHSTARPHGASWPRRRSMCAEARPCPASMS